MSEFKVGDVWYDDSIEDTVTITHVDQFGVTGEFGDGSGEYAYSYDEFLQLCTDTDTDTDTRQHFTGGGMRDVETGKPRFDLLCPERVPFEHQYLTRVAKLMGRGAEHYEDRNWEQFADDAAYQRARSSAFRHFMQWFNGETDEDHAASVFFNVQAAEYVAGRMRGDW